MELQGWKRYERLETIGHGAYGTVYLARDLADHRSTDGGTDDDDSRSDIVAIKCVALTNVSAKEGQQAMSEAAILRQLDHPHVLRFLDCFVDDDSYLCVVTEFVDGGDMTAFQRRAAAGSIASPLGAKSSASSSEAPLIDALVVADLAEQALDGLVYLHTNHVLHRDLKPNNLYLTKSGDLKIGDFGVAKLLTSSVPQAGTFIGTPFYMAPEVCLGDPYSYAADVWSLGVLLYELYVGKLPFVANNVLALIHHVTEGTYDVDSLSSRPYGTQAVTATTGLGAELQADICHLISSLIQACLTVDPFQRPTAAALLSEFFRKPADPAMFPEYDPAYPIDEEVLDWTPKKEQPTAEVPTTGLEAAEGDAAPAWLRDSTALSEMELAEPPTARRHEQMGSGGGPRLHYDPKELEAKIRQKALIHHRKRLEAAARQRSDENVKKAQVAAALHQQRAQREAEEARHAEQAAARAARWEGAQVRAIERAQESVAAHPAEPPAPSSIIAAQSSHGGGGGGEESPWQAATKSQAVLESVRRVAAAIVEQDPARAQINRALMTARTHAGDDDDDEDERPLHVTVMTGERIAQVKGLKTTSGFKKLSRRVRKALGLDADAPLGGDLVYRDLEGDEVAIMGKREWALAVQDCVDRGADTALVLRLVPHDGDDGGAL